MEGSKVLLTWIFEFTLTLAHHSSSHKPPWPGRTWLRLFGDLEKRGLVYL